MLPRSTLPRIIRSLFPTRATPRKAPTRRLGFELLEGRDVPSVTPLHLYELNGSLADQMGGPALESDGGALNANRYVFDPNQGLRLSGGLTDTANYSIVMTANLNYTNPFDPFFKKIIDFQARASDFGLYVSGEQLNLYPGDLGAGFVGANQDFNVGLTRDAASGVTRIYLNGILSQTYIGLPSDAAIPLGNVLTFFEDDFVTGGFEAVGGNVDYIAIYNRPLTDAEVAEIAQFGPAVPPSVAVNQPALNVNEGQVTSNSGTWANAISLSATIGTVSQHTNGTWTWSFTAADGPSQSQTVTISALGNTGLTATTSFQLTVNNVAPTATFANNGPITYGQTATVSFSNQQDAPTDTTAGFHYAYSLTGDFTGITYASGSSTAATQSYAGLNAGAYTIYARIIDKDDGFTEVSSDVTVAKAPTITTAVGGTFTYDGLAHGGSGSVNVPGGVVTISYVGTNGTIYNSTAAPINAGSYSVVATYAGDANHEASTGTAPLIINPKQLSVSAWSQGTINIGSNGSIVLHLSIDSGQFYNADTVASLFNGATFTVRIQNGDGTITFATLTSVAEVHTDGSIRITMQMNEALRAELYDAYVSGRAVNFNMTATSNGGNYFLDEDTMSRLLNNGALRYVV